MSRNECGRRPVEIIEIDMDQCIHLYGDSACSAVLSAGGEKCFNTISSCQSLPDYLPDPHTIRFCTDQMDVPSGAHYFPFLSSVRVQPGQINPGGTGRNSGPLGKRAQITATFTDHPAVDRVVDKYYDERITGEAREDGIGYNPAERSTFWRKWRARNQYYLNRPMRYISGYLDEDGNVVDALVRHFVITGFSGPGRNGSVSITGHDVLVLAQREKAQAPLPSPGKLVSDISAGASSFMLDPVGVGDGAYPASGWVCIGSEIIEFTRSGDTMTVAGRGEYNTEAESHGSGDTVQLCWQIGPEDVPDILFPLLNDFSDIDSQFLDYAQWQVESATYLPLLYETIVAKPTDVEKLLSEMCEQMYFYMWFDEIDNKVRIRSIRPADGETVKEVTESANTIADTVSMKDKTDEVLTRVVVNYGIRNPVEKLDEPSNYRVTDIFADLEEEGDDRSRTKRTKTIFSRWLDHTASAQVEQLGQRLLARYRVPPREIAFAQDAKDRDLWLADFINFSDRKIVTETGLPIPVPAQIMAVEEDEAGTRFAYRAQQFQFQLPANPGEKPLEIGADDYNINLRELYDSRYAAAPVDDDVIRLTIRPGVVIGSTSTSEPALEILSADWPSGTTIIVEVGADAYLVGRGGDGGQGGASSGDGQIGGNAILLSRAASIDNTGIIGGGGGGGGGAGGSDGITLGGGGGAGRNPGNGGAGSSQGGSLDSGGNGGSLGGTFGAGDGGDLGLPGEDGSNTFESFGLGANPGPAIDGASFVTYINKGDVRGPEIN